jgi:hypothetical protein
MVAAIEHDGDARKFIFGSYLDEPRAMIDVDTSETIYYYHQNRLYNVAAMTDSSGNVVERYTFSAYGLPLILTGAGTDTTWGTTDDVFATNPSASAIESSGDTILNSKVMDGCMSWQFGCRCCPLLRLALHR